MENPNSYSSINIITDRLYDVACRDERNWTFVGADGPPYCIMRRLKEANPKKYAWLAPVSGKGHLKMNMLKSIFKFGDTIMLDILGQDVLKFDTFKAYNYFIKCKDNHKSYQALEILLNGTTMELIRLYSKDINYTPTVEGFLEWTSTVSDPTLKFVCEFILGYVLAIYVHRVGDRFNDSKCSDAGRMKFFDFFFALNHPIYREVEYNDLRERALYTKEVTALREKNSTYANEKGELVHNHQDGDFKLEERVKMMKRLSPKGQKDEKMWLRVARGMDDVEKVVEHGRELLHMENEEAIRITPLENEIVKWRAQLRRSNYLQTGSQHVRAINGQNVNAELENLTESVKKRRVRFFEMARSTNLENIRYENLNVKSEGADYSDEEISPYNSAEEVEEEEY